MKKILLMLLCTLVIIKLCSAEQPTINASEVERTYFFLAKRAGAIEGYLIFYDKDARQCAVRGRFKARLYCGGKYNPSFEKTLDINPSDFQPIETKGGDSYYGYIIEPFFINGWRGSFEVNFEWDTIIASTIVISD